jgi:DNA-binding CsgD family transcriptional regulator
VCAHCQPFPQDRPEGDRVSTEYPFDLTPYEALSMTAFTEAGGTKLAARLIGRSHKTIEVHVNAARKKMGHSTPLQAALTWDRLIRNAE